MTDEEAEAVLCALAGAPFPWLQPGVWFEAWQPHDPAYVMRGRVEARFTHDAGEWVRYRCHCSGPESWLDWHESVHTDALRHYEQYGYVVRRWESPRWWRGVCAWWRRLWGILP